MPQKLRINAELFLSFFVGENQIPCTFDLNRMPLSRSYRTDRRRRVMRETIAADSDFAVESARAQKKARRASESDPTELLLGSTDKGYSQGVRKTCQHRLVQLIPIRPGSLATVLTILWCAWGTLLFCHYWFHVRANSMGRSPVLLWQLFDLRSPHSIANWLTCQLWMMTALCAWLIFQLRRHKADDYSARYRIWILLTGVAIFSSFDTSTASLFLLGQSIDPWTRSEIGYGGWPLVLATYASFVGLIGLRLSTELKSTPGALVLWIGGLVSWATAALLGTGLLKLDWSPGTIDLIVGACWLGGVLAVFQAAGLYLRQCYLQAQKRFLERTALAKQSGFAMPKLPWKRSADPDARGESNDSDEDVLGTIPKRSWLPWRNRSADDEDLEDEYDEDEAGTDTSRRKAASTTTKSSPKKSVALDAFGEPKKPMRLFGFIPHRSERNEQIDDVADGELLREDDGGPVDVGLTKKSSWFGRKVPASTDAESEAPSPKKQSIEKQPAAKKPSTQVPSDSDADAPDTETREKRRWLAKFWKSKTAELANDADTDVSSPKPSSSKPIAAKASLPEPAALKSKSVVDDDEDAAPKKSWFPFGRAKSDPSDPNKGDDLAASKKGASEPKPKKEPKEPKAPKEPGQQRVKKLVGRITSWLDGLKLKPPVDESTESGSTGSDGSVGSRAGSSGPKTIDSSRPLPGTQSGSSSQSSSSASDTNDDDDNSEDYRYLSKAERKRMRRQQNDRGAA